MGATRVLRCNGPWALGQGIDRKPQNWGCLWMCKKCIADGRSFGVRKGICFEGKSSLTVEDLLKYRELFVARRQWHDSCLLAVVGVQWSDYGWPVERFKTL